MPYREVGMLEIKEVLRLWLAGVSKQRIARLVHVDRKTVRRYIALAVEQGVTPAPGGALSLTEEQLASVLLALRRDAGRQHGASWTRCVEHRAFIEARLGEAKLSKVRRLLLRQGIEIPYPTLHRFAVTELGYGRAAATIPIRDPAPGMEVQVDTGWVGSFAPDLFGKRRRFRAWIFTAVCSRHRFVYPVQRETTASAIEACEAAWAYFGGVFPVLIADNTKAIVQVADALGATITRVFLEYAQARGFHVDATRSRRPRDKARVERSVQTVRDDCFAAELLPTLDDARHHAARWAHDEYGMRRHSTTHRRPLEYFEAAEQPHLLPAPTDAYDIPLWAEPKVARDQHAQVDRALYSLPLDYRGQIVHARADRATVRFYRAGILIKTHPRMAPGQRSTDPSDFPPEKAAYALRDLTFLKEQADRHGTAVGELATIILDGPLPWTRMRRVYALLRLARKFGSTRVNTACRTALAFEMYDVRRLQRIIETGAPPPPPTAPSPTVIPRARYLRPPSQYALSLREATPEPSLPSSLFSGDPA
jgi:transposase